MELTGRAVFVVLEYLRNTRFPVWIEWILAWTLVVLSSIRYCLDWLWNHLRLRAIKCLSSFSQHQQELHEIPISVLPQTRRRQAETKRIRAKELIRILRENNRAHNNENNDIINQDDDVVVALLRSNLMARRLASLIMVSSPSSSSSLDSSDNHESNEDDDIVAMISQLHRLWPRLLKIPNDEGEKQEDYEFSISLIVPAYKERPEAIQQTLRHTLKHCKSPKEVQVIVVDAGGCVCPTTNNPLFSMMLSKTTKEEWDSSSWGQFHVVPLMGSGGRGGTLNFGASYARGRILTFLHSDSLLPDGWDNMIREALGGDGSSPDLVHACAFTMGINLEELGTQRLPGIVGAELLGVLRCRLCSLPYGDSALSFPSFVFRYLGGYPDQPLMEDYEIMRLLRQRALLLDNERLVVLPAKLKCSPRRWQAYGVCYTVLVNALCILWYNRGATAEDLFELYYRRPKKEN